MFLKPVNIKSNSKIKASERKQLLDSFRAQYKLEVNVLPSALSSTNVFRLKLATSELCHVTVLKYDDHPLLIEHENRLIPTIFLLWLIPDLLPSFTTHESLIPKLASGADLMLPGLVLDQPLTPKSFDGIEKGILCSIITSSNRAPFAVGHTAMSSYDMFMSGGRGKVVIVYHIIGDNVCSLGPPVSRPLLVHPAHSSVSQEKLGNEAATASEEESQLPLHASMGDLDIGQDNAVDMDDLLRCSFLRALKLLKDKQLPMPVNVFYAQHLLAQKPPAIDLDIKKTSYKKVSVFLKAMQDQGLVSVTEPQPGILTLTSINHDHDALCNVKALNEPNNSVPSKKSTNDWPPGYHGPPHIEEVRIITGPSSALFNLSGYGPNACILQSEVRKVVDQYVRQRGLQRKDDPSLVQLDPLLMKFCNPNMYLEAAESTLANPVYLMRFQQLFSCTLQQLPLAYRISPPEGAGPSLLWRKKQPPVIDLTVVMKNGKKLTRVSNLETFTIDPDAFAKRLQLTLACSAGRVEDPQHRDTITIQAQGSHEAAVSKILTETYGIHKRYIKGYMESTKPKGRK
ncbi:hypothetical protein CRM22_003349 [Opisthorchis felineus]|uniref:SUI1 domain-containing protein n=1 Tax=Opisthorchis felineus TaxID=147828 RepID=A0A4V3SFY7_OPIFE|nr:hypothetical protein CRM22_003349 [Opisthorchis felineus]